MLELRKNRRTYASYRRPMIVREALLLPCAHGEELYYVCPRCGLGMEREFVSFCDRCGQRLDWRECDIDDDFYSP